jgi:hypothetical protein
MSRATKPDPALQSQTRTALNRSEPLCGTRFVPRFVPQVLVGLAGPDDAQLRPVLLRPDNRRLPLPRQVLEARGLEQRLVELSTKTLGARDRWARGGG